MDWKTFMNFTNSAMHFLIGNVFPCRGRSGENLQDGVEHWIHGGHPQRHFNYLHSWDFACSLQAGGSSSGSNSPSLAANRQPCACFEISLANGMNSKLLDIVLLRSSGIHDCSFSMDKLDVPPDFTVSPVPPEMA